MNTDNDRMITIPYEDYKALQRKLACLENDFEKCQDAFNLALATIELKNRKIAELQAQLA